MVQSLNINNNINYIRREDLEGENSHLLIIDNKGDTEYRPTRKCNKTYHTEDFSGNLLELGRVPFLSAVFVLKNIIL